MWTLALQPRRRSRPCEEMNRHAVSFLPRKGLPLGDPDADCYEFSRGFELLDALCLCGPRVKPKRGSTRRGRSRKRESQA